MLPLRRLYHPTSLIRPFHRRITSHLGRGQRGLWYRELVLQDLKPKDIVTRASFENAMVTVMALGGSTNAVLHLIAMARAFDIELTIDDFQSVSMPLQKMSTAISQRTFCLFQFCQRDTAGW